VISIRQSAKGNLVGSNSIRCLSFYDRYSPKKHRCKKSFCHWLEYSGPFSVAVMLDDPADVTLLYDERYVGWSSTSLVACPKLQVLAPRLLISSKCSL